MGKFKMYDFFGAAMDSQLLWGFIGLFLASIALSGKLSISASYIFLLVAWIVGCFGIYRSGLFSDWHMLLGVWLFLGSALAFTGSWLQPSIPLAKSKPEMVKPSAAPTLSDLFKSDFPNVMKFSDDRIGVQWKNGDVLPIKSQVYADFPAKTLFVGYYIASSPKTYEACLRLADAVKETIESLSKRVAVRAGYRDQSNRLEELTFSGRALVYHEDFLSIKQKAAIIDAYTAKNLDVQFRGPDYLADQVIAWHRRHDPRPMR